MDSQISKGWCKIDGHNLPRHRKGFLKAKKFQKSKAQKKSKFQKELNTQRLLELRASLDQRFKRYSENHFKEKLIRIIFFLFILAGILGLVIHFYDSFNNYEENFETSANETILNFGRDWGENYVFHIQEGKLALGNNQLKKAEGHFRKAENIFQNGRHAIGGLSIALARQCLEAGENCNQASIRLKYAWDNAPKNYNYWNYIKLVESQKGKLANY